MSLCSYHKLVMAPCCRLLITPSFTPGVLFSETKTTTNSHLSPHFISQNKNEHSGSNFSVSVSTIYHHHKLKAELALLVQFGCLAGSNTSYFNCSHLKDCLCKLQLHCKIVTSTNTLQWFLKLLYLLAFYSK